MNNASLLLVNASSRYQDSLKRAVSAEIAQYMALQNGLVINERDVAAGLPFVDEQWVNANFTDPAGRSDA